MFGEQLVHAFEEVKDRFDPGGLFNPGKIVRAPNFDDRTNFRYGPGYHGEPMTAVLDWSAYPGVGGGFQGAVEMCNNNGACRALAGGVMCPSYRATRDEKDVTRGRANTLRLAVTGQLGPDALTSDEMAETMKLCVSCKGCRRECPTGVDMARMKIEVLAARAAKHGLTLAQPPRRLAAALRADRGALPLAVQSARPHPRRGGAVRKPRRVLRAPDPAALAQRLVPRRRGRATPSPACGGGSGRGPRRLKEPLRSMEARRPPNSREVILFADTFNRYFEPENLRAALAVLRAGGYRVEVATPADGSARPLCCGRTFLAVGRVDKAREEAERTLAALAPYASRGVPIIGLEPSCLFSFRDEIPAIIKDGRAAEVAGRAVLFEEFLAGEAQAGRLALPLAPLRGRALLHGHCHQKSFDAMGAVTSVLKLVPELAVETIEFELLRHGRRFRLSRRHRRRFARHGRALPAAGGAQRAGRCHYRRRRHLLPAPDQGRNRADRGSRGAGHRALSHDGEVGRLSDRQPRFRGADPKGAPQYASKWPAAGRVFP